MGPRAALILTAAPAILLVTVLATRTQPGVAAPLSAQDTALGPARRHSMGMACDGTRREVVLFGGTNGPRILNDTWTWDGATWTKESPASLPQPHYGMGMAYDAARREVVVFGGTNGVAFLNDT
jgi:hypothetical protein